MLAVKIVIPVYFLAKYMWYGYRMLYWLNCNKYTELTVAIYNKAVICDIAKIWYTE